MHQFSRNGHPKMEGEFIPKAPAQTPEQVLAKRILARRRLISFIEEFHPGYKAGWVHRDVCRRLENFKDQIEKGLHPRLMLFLPPRSGKSEIVSKMFPAWLMGHHPDWEQVISSYNQDLPTGFSRQIREIVQLPEYRALFPKVTISKDSRSVERWNTTRKGQLLAVGRGSGLTGKGFHCMPLKTKVETTLGLRTLDSLIRAGQEAPDVLSFNGTQIVRRKIRAFYTREVEEVYRVTASTGDFEATGEHPICVNIERGKPVFRRVDDLQEGEKLVVIDPKTTEIHEDVGELPCMRDKVHKADVEVQSGKNRLREHVTHMLKHLFSACKAPEGKVHPRMRRVWEGFCKSTRQLKEQVSLLFKRVQQQTPQQDVSGDAPPHVQFGGAEVLAMRHEVQPRESEGVCGEDEEPVLQQGMLRSLVNWSPYPEGYRAEWGSILPRRVQKVESTDNEGWSLLWHLHEACKRFTPQRWGQREQRCGKLVADVQELSQSDTQWADFAEITRIEKIHGTITVCDLEVEKDHNFIIQNNFLSINCGIIDDILSNSEESDSELIRQRTWDWYSSTFYTRQHPGGGICLLMTRWHDADLAGQLIEQMKTLRKEGIPEAQIDNWEIISYPAIATGDEYINQDGTITEVPRKGQKFIKVRSKGDALHPERYDEAYLKKVKTTIQPRHWSALYQQNPVPDEGAYFRKAMFRHEEMPNHSTWGAMRRVVVADLAIGERQVNDWTVFCVAGLDFYDQIHILDIIRFRGDAQKIIDTALDLCKKYKPDLLGFEKGVIEMTLMSQFMKTLRERQKEDRALRVALAQDDMALSPNKDKQARSRPLQGRMQQGMVYFAQEPWMEDLEHEFLRFPAGVHDDIVDAVSWAADTLLKMQPPKKPKRMQKKSWKDKLKAHIGSTSPRRSHMVA